MLDDVRAPVEAVRGEMQPWSDNDGSRPPTGGPALLRLLADVLRDGTSTLILGPHSTAVIEEVARRGGSVTVLLRSVGDANELNVSAPSNVSVVTGALDGLVASGYGPYDVVLAADGLDRLMGTDSPAATWPDRLAMVARLAAAGAMMMVGLENIASLPGLLDGRLPEARHGDDEWRPLGDDPLRPASPTMLATALADAGADTSRIFATYGSTSSPDVLLDADAALVVQAGSVAARAATAAMESAHASAPLLASVAEGAEAFARAGLLGAIAPGWLAVCGTALRSDLYIRMSGGAGVLTADRDGDAWRVRKSPAWATDEGEVTVHAEAVPERIPAGESVEVLLRRLAAAEDVPGFRAFAARLGEWARSADRRGTHDLIAFDDLYPAALSRTLPPTGGSAGSSAADLSLGVTFVSGVFGLVATAAADADELLAAAWHRFESRLLAEHRRHPWPPWLASASLAAMWLGFSGAKTTEVVLRRGAALAAAAAALVDTPVSEIPDVRTALASAAAAQHELVELKGHIFGLERTLGFRDRQLASREKIIKQMRRDMRRKAHRLAQTVVETTDKVRKVGGDPRRIAAAVRRRIRDR